MPRIPSVTSGPKLNRRSSGLSRLSPVPWASRHAGLLGFSLAMCLPALLSGAPAATRYVLERWEAGPPVIPPDAERLFDDTAPPLPMPAPITTRGALLEPSVAAALAAQREQPFVNRVPHIAGFSDLSPELQRALVNRVAAVPWQPRVEGLPALSPDATVGLPLHDGDARMMAFLVGWSGRSELPLALKTRVAEAVRVLAQGGPPPGDAVALEPELAGTEAVLTANLETLTRIQQVAKGLVPIRYSGQLPKRDALVDLARLMGLPGGTGSSLEAPDKRGGTLLDALHRLATQPLVEPAREAGLSQAIVLGSLVGDVARDGPRGQGFYRTCVAATFALDVLRKESAGEMPRLIAGLLTDPEGVVLANGERMSAVADAFARDRSGRTVTQRVVQAALMNFAAPWYERYSNRRDGHGVIALPGWFPLTWTHEGLKAPEALRLFEAVLARPFRVMEASHGGEGEGLLDVLRTRSGHDTLAFLDWSGTQHAVTFERAEHDRFYFRNPMRWGPVAEPLRTDVPQPPERRIEDASVGLESIEDRDLAPRLRAVFVPR